MSKFTDDYFKFPIIMYDGASVESALAKEQRDLETNQEILDNYKPEFAVGYARLPAKEFDDSNVIWMETYKKGDSLDDVASSGFQETLVISKNWGDFQCAWDMKKFEEMLNSYMAKREKGA